MTLDNADPLTIVQCGDPILRRPAEAIDPSDLPTAELQDLILRMRATMHAAPGVGLAAPQVGVPIRLAVLEDGPERWSQLSDENRGRREREALPFTVLVNPTYQAVGDAFASFYEGCLSVPGLTGVVPRHRAVQVTALDQHGEPIDRVFLGWAARIVQHEVDHLGGHLYLDRVETRSLSTVDNYAQRWAQRPLSDAGRLLGFTIDEQPQG